MAPHHTTVTVQPDGNIVIPVGRDDAGHSYLVHLIPIPKAPLSSEQALASLNSFIGSCPDWDFVEPEDEPPEEIEPLD